MGELGRGYKTVMLAPVISFASGLVVMFLLLLRARNTPAIRRNPYSD